MTMLKVLVVDDDQDGAYALSKCCEMWGYKAKAAYGGSEAVEAYQDFQPHVILLDIIMPRMNGYEVARQIKFLSQGRKITIIGTTALWDESYRHQSWDAGFTGYMVKPVDFNALKKILDNALRSLELEEKSQKRKLERMMKKIKI